MRFTHPNGYPPGAWSLTPRFHLYLNEWDHEGNPQYFQFMQAVCFLWHWLYPAIAESFLLGSMVLCVVPTFLHAQGVATEELLDDKDTIIPRFLYFCTPPQVS